MSSLNFPVRVLQFGDGVFLRAFTEMMVHEMNENAAFGASVAVVKARPGAFDAAYAVQHNRYTLVSKGIRNGKAGVERTNIDVISKLIHPYEDFDAFLAEAENPELRLIVSNTTEAGIAESPGDSARDKPAASFPGKLTQFLRRRYESLGTRTSGTELVVMPCELIENNGSTLRDIVMGHAKRWYADAKFESWLETGVRFVDTLVDRIVSGFKEDEYQETLKTTGFEDRLLVVAEPYHFLAIQGPESLERMLPFRRAGLNVVWTDDIASFRLRKVRMLNGSHTFIAMCGLGLGLENVESCMKHPVLSTALETMQRSEILPLLARTGPGASSADIAARGTELEAYLQSVFERFRNPYLDHRLAGIALNTCAKWKARLGGALAGYTESGGKPPYLISFSLAAFFHKYLEGRDLKDEPAVLSTFAGVSRVSIADPKLAARMLLRDETLWGQGSSLAGVLQFGELEELVGRQLSEIYDMGMERALARSLDDAVASREGEFV